jgi:hypothetical protein
MTRLALLAMVVVLAGACSTAGDDAATSDTNQSVIAPAPDSLRDSLRDTADTTRRDTDTTAAR